MNLLGIPMTMDDFVQKFAITSRFKTVFTSAVYQMADLSLKKLTVGRRRLLKNVTPGARTSRVRRATPQNDFPGFRRPGRRLNHKADKFNSRKLAPVRH